MKKSCKKKRSKTWLIGLKNWMRWDLTRQIQKTLKLINRVSNLMILPMISETKKAREI